MQILRILGDHCFRSPNTSPPDDTVYNFMDKKRSEGKPYYVYLTAGANRFLRIYVGRAKEYLARLPKEQN